MKEVVFCILFVISSVFASAQENLIIRKIKFEGNKHFSNSKLSEEISIESNNWIKEKIFKKEPVYFTQDLYNDDISRLKLFYQKEGYLNVSFEKPEIEINKKNKIVLTVFIQEGEPVLVSEVSFLVDSTYTLGDVLRKRNENKVIFRAEASNEKVFRDEAITNDKLLIADAFYDEGHPYTLVTHKLDVDTASNSTKVKWLINRGPLSYFGSTIVVGNKRIPSKNIIRQLAYSEGDIWSKKKIDQTQKQIYNQGNYQVASVKTQISSELLDTLPIQIKINEAPRWTTRFGAGYGREDNFRAFTEIQYLSFITKTGRLNLYAKHSGLEPYNFYLRFSQPSFLFKINTLSIYPFMQRQNEPGYKLDKIGYNITFLQNFSKELNTSIGYVYENVEQDTTDVSSDELATYNESLYNKSGIVIGAIYNNSDPILDPVQGYSLSLNTKTNDLLAKSRIPFFRVLTDLRTYIALKKGTVLALKAKIGGITTSSDNLFIPVEERFYAGGSHSVRGWARSELGPKDANGKPIGGNSLLEASAELRYEIGRRLKLAVFVDAGNVWSKSFSYHFNDLRYAAGAGISIKTPIGPAGVNFARPILDEEKNWQFHLNIGHSF